MISSVIAWVRGRSAKGSRNDQRSSSASVISAISSP
jgi:hypothetical protein